MHHLPQGSRSRPQLHVLTCSAHRRKIPTQHQRLRLIADTPGCHRTARLQRGPLEGGVSALSPAMSQARVQACDPHTCVRSHALRCVQTWTCLLSL